MAYLRLQRSLLFWQLIHIGALISMLLLLAPGLDFTASALTRATYVSENPWLWRLGWLPWQLCALSDLLVTLALLSWSWKLQQRGRIFAVFALLFTIAAILPEQYAEFSLITGGIEQAQALVNGDILAADYIAYENWGMLMTGTLGNYGYTLMTLCWVIVLASTQTPWRKPMVVLGVVTCGLFTIAGALVWAGYAGKVHMSASAPANALAFPMLAIWGLLASVVAGSIHRADPSAESELSQIRGTWMSLFSEPGLRDLLRPLPFIRMKSDIRDVVYLNWLLPVDRLQPFVPAGLQLRTLGDKTIFSILTYRHGHFGPKCLGPLRKLMPSPIQSNWRVQIDPHHEVGPTVFFIKTSLSSLPLTLAARLFSDGLPAQWVSKATHETSKERIELELKGTWESTPDLHAKVKIEDQHRLPENFANCFNNYEDALVYLTNQSGAVSIVDGTVLHSAISIPIAAADVQAASLEFANGELLHSLIYDTECFAFIAPSVPFQVLGERIVFNQQ